MPRWKVRTPPAAPVMAALIANDASLYGMGEMPWARTSGSFCLIATSVRPIRELHSA